jgi:hypothetical protein
MPDYSDPVVWLDAFIAAYQAANGGRSPQIDYLAFHWYDYGLSDQLDRLAKYGKQVWVTELANWHSRRRRRGDRHAGQAGGADDRHGQHLRDPAPTCSATRGSPAAGAATRTSRACWAANAGELTELGQPVPVACLSRALPGASCASSVILRLRAG